MPDSSHDPYLIYVLVTRLKNQRLPRALKLKEQVDRGELLSDIDIQFLKEVFRDTQDSQGILSRNPEWQPLVTKMISLYKEITDKALENERRHQEKSS